MTLRSIILGLLGVFVVCGYTYFNDGILRQNMFVGNHMPIGVYGILLLFMLVANPLLARVSKERDRLFGLFRPLSIKELAVILALALPACCVPYSSMLRILPRVLMLPHHYERTEPSWHLAEESRVASEDDSESVLELLPERMLADVETNSDECLTGYVQGLAPASGSVSLRDIPWYAWTRTLAFWLPLVGILWVAMIGLAAAVHRQWAEHEHLPYPVVEFTKALLPPPEGGISAVFRSPAFWIGTTGVILFHANNYAFVYWPDELIRIPQMFDFHPAAKLFPTFVKGGGWPLLWIRFYFSAVAIAYFLSTDVSFAVGIGPFIFKYIGGLLATYGIPMGSGTRFSPRIDKNIVFGGYVGFFLAMLYTGRHYYGNLVRHALFLRSKEKIDDVAVWGIRIFTAGMALFVIDLCLLGLDWQIAVAYSILAVMIFLVMGRIIAETGLFYIAPYLYPCVLIYGFMGGQVIDPRVLMIMFVLTCVLLIDPREALMPYLVNTIKLSEDCELRPGRVLLCACAAVFIGLAVAVPVTLYFNYDRGVNWDDVFGTKMVPKFAADGAVLARQRLLAQDLLEDSYETSGWECFRNIKPDRASSIGFAAGLAGVLLCVAARLRFARWPLHPVVFLVWSGYAGHMMAWSFLIGCFLKVVTTRYGGAQAYSRIKPLMFGLIAGDMLSGILVILTGLSYYLVTGEPPKQYWVMPR